MAVPQMAAPVSGAAAASPALLGPRLPYPEEWGNENGVPRQKWSIAVNTVFPNAATVAGVADAFLIALDKANGDQSKIIPLLQRMQIVKVWHQGDDREMPYFGIAHWRSVAQASGLAGVDPVVFGPTVTKTFEGKVRIDGKLTTIQHAVTFPEWGEVAVYRMVGGVRACFTKRVYFEEAFAREPNCRGPVPNETWRDKPRSMLDKVCENRSLKSGFDEVGDAAEAMVGQDISSLARPSTEVPSGTTGVRFKEEPLPRVDGDLTTAPVVQPFVLDLSKVSDEVAGKIVRVVLRAKQSGQWEAAREHFRSRYKKDEHSLAFALQEVDHAERFKEIAEPMRVATNALVERAKVAASKAATPEAADAVWNLARAHLLKQNIDDAGKTFGVADIDRAEALHRAGLLKEIIPAT